MINCSLRLGAGRYLGARRVSSFGRTHRRVPVKRVIVPRAADKEKKDEGEGKSNKGDRVIDWDAAWQQIGRELRGTGSTNPRDYVDMASQSRRDDAAREAKDQVKRDENLILNTWTSDEFTKIGLTSVAALLFFFIVVIGPPPSDGRCTLPWC